MNYNLDINIQILITLMDPLSIFTEPIVVLATWQLL